MEEFCFTQEDTEKCQPLKKKLKKCPMFSEKRQESTDAIWTDVRRERSIKNEGDIGEQEERREVGTELEEPVEPNVAHSGSYKNKETCVLFRV